MLNSTLRNKIEQPEIRLLYDSRMYLSSPIIREEVRKCISKIRKESKRNHRDPLIDKELRFGNNGKWGKIKAKELQQILFNQKGVPNTAVGDWRSIEFECIFKSKQTLNDFILFIRSKSLSKFITIKEDGSIRKEKYGEQEREIVVSYKTGDEYIVREVCHNLADKAYANASCGTHVHFDMRNIDRAAVGVIGKKLARYVPALRSLLPVYRRDNEYCRNTISSVDNDRYSFINLTSYSKYNTLEIRGHSGTIIASKILNWIRICEIIMSSDEGAVSKKMKTVDDLIADFGFKFDELLVDYIKKRAKRFGKASSPVLIVHGAEQSNNCEDTLEELGLC